MVELKRALRLTDTAVRRHVQKLQADGLVSCFPRAQKIGRPENIYRLTEKATTDYFPTGYEELSSRVLDTIFNTDGHKGSFEFLLATNRILIQEMSPKFANRSLEDRVQLLAEHFRSNGYMTDIRKLPAGRFFLYHQNCAIFNLASKYRQLCFMELKLIEALAGTKVTRRQYIFKGHPFCGYLIAAEP